MLWKILKALLITYIIGGVVLYIIQDLLLFHPTPLPGDHSFTFSQPFKELNISVANRNLNVVKFTTNKNRKGIVLYFHGNMNNVERYSPYASLFTKNGYELWMMDYPGFGKSSGRLTEETLYKDAALLYALAIKEVPASNLIIYGKSLGTGVAAQLASTQYCQQLILETGYYSMPDVAKSKFPIYPVHWLVKYSFPVYEFLPKVKAPVTLFHGTDDEVIPYSHAKKLQIKNPSIKLITLPNGKHNNLTSFPLFIKELDLLLGSKTLAPF